MNDFESALGLEAVATGIEAFEPLLITGVLQTEAYARELISYHASIALGVNVEESVDLRMRRKAIITRDDNPVIDNWRKSSFSANNATCVETGWIDTTVAYRDTKQAVRAFLTRITR
ncbi:Scr1 family TA system antitoxin-like transcriptional regulator [Actinokineospora sp. G85]|uniref:DUF397 domain-containing protein n=1 Tax=Actinokineospora sp. G85 TaxID=3406626 RepID=UPI003C76939E